MALATPTDVTDRLGRTLTSVEARRIDALLDDATAAVQTAVGGNPFQRATTTDRIRIRDGKIRLPLYPVHAVISVKWPDPLATSVGWWFWEGLNEVTLWRSEFGLPSISATPYLRAFYKVVDVEYDHGWATIPQVVVSIVANVVARALSTLPDDAGLKAETIQGYSYQRDPVALAGGFALLPEELEALKSVTILDRMGSLPISSTF